MGNKPGVYATQVGENVEADQVGRVDTRAEAREDAGRRVLLVEVVLDGIDDQQPGTGARVRVVVFVSRPGHRDGGGGAARAGDERGDNDGAAVGVDGQTLLEVADDAER